MKLIIFVREDQILPSIQVLFRKLNDIPDNIITCPQLVPDKEKEEKRQVIEEFLILKTLTEFLIEKEEDDCKRNSKNCKSYW